MIVILDDERVYKFMIGYVFKMGANFYRIEGIEQLEWSEALSSLAAASTTTKEFKDYMQPLPGFAYFVERLAIDGRLGFALQFPKGIVHGAPRGETHYIYFERANLLNPYYKPFVITSPNYPTFALYNPHSAANVATAWFFGWRWRIKKLEGLDIPPAGQYTELTDYQNQGIGQG